MTKKAKKHKDVMNCESVHEYVSLCGVNTN